MMTIEADKARIELKDTIDLLEKEGAGPTMYENLNILAMAVLWSSETYKIVEDAVKQIQENHIISPGHWR